MELFYHRHYYYYTVEDSFIGSSRPTLFKLLCRMDTCLLSMQLYCEVVVFYSITNNKMTTLYMLAVRACHMSRAIHHLLKEVAKVYAYELKL